MYSEKLVISIDLRAWTAALILTGSISFAIRSIKVATEVIVFHSSTRSTSGVVRYAERLASVLMDSAIYVGTKILFALLSPPTNNKLPQSPADRASWTKILSLIELSFTTVRIFFPTTYTVPVPESSTTEKGPKPVPCVCAKVFT